jgi:restriction system protein
LLHLWLNATENKMNKPRMWMARGDSGRLYDEFQERGLVALGWWELAEAKPGMSRKQLAEMYRRKQADYKHGTILSGASQVWRFLNEIEINDYVITYNPSTRRYLVGQVLGAPKVEPELRELDMVQTRKVKWMREIDRDALSVKTKNSLGSTLTLFRLPESATDEVMAVVKGQKPPQQEEVGEMEEDEEPSEPKELLAETELRALEFIKDRVNKLDWEEMQELIAGILRAMGYKTRIAKPGADRGADIIASPDGLGFETPRIVVEVKHRQGSSMGSKEIRSFLGGRHKDDRGLYVSTGGYTKDARYEGDRAGIPVTLWELDDVVRALVEYYDQVDSETRQLVPLKRIYWPT